MQLKRSTYEILQILSIFLMDETNLRDLFNETNFNDVKEIDCPFFEGLCDYSFNYWILINRKFKIGHKN